ncbi:hypothetical protein NFI95_04975 [Acetobacteraceae bacterium KSS8]|uniref:Uncharacterized protein n=1 Tax=Endosaccharibacter trunci TaxID=2812733 RepID=A0ABT1W4I0_9PROT|nr:hypothetical protein [Acetobacteraceae bacterium KSS8]
MSGATTPAIAVGSVADMIARMRAVLPFAWFPLTEAGSASETPVLDAVLSGIGSAWSFCFGLLNYVQSQTRLSTANGTFLDLFAADFFGTSITRKAFETDDAFRSRISASLLLPRATRTALSDTLFRLIGLRPWLFEPRRAADTGAYGVAGLGYGSSMPFQYLVSLDANGGVIRRESVATYVDIVGQLQIAPRHTARPVYSSGSWVSFLVEPSGFNLLKDSLGFTGWSASSTGAVASWLVNASPAIALLSGYPTLELTVAGAGSFPGPSIETFIGDQSVTASLWIWLPSGHTLTQLRLQCGDASENAHADANLTLVNQWQRLITTIDGTSGIAKTIAAWLIGTSTGPTSNKIVTQCWQVEPGTAATSFIPSSGQIGVRDLDRVVGDISSNDPFILVRDDILEAVGRTAPAGSVAWMNIQLRQ